MPIHPQSVLKMPTFICRLLFLLDALDFESDGHVIADH
jgi:hypothetical protein